MVGGVAVTRRWSTRPPAGSAADDGSSVMSTTACSNCGGVPSSRRPATTTSAPATTARARRAAPHAAGPPHDHDFLPLLARVMARLVESLRKEDTTGWLAAMTGSGIDQVLAPSVSAPGIPGRSNRSPRSHSVLVDVLGTFYLGGGGTARALSGSVANAFGRRVAARRPDSRSGRRRRSSGRVRSLFRAAPSSVSSVCPPATCAEAIEQAAAPIADRDPTGELLDAVLAKCAPMMRSD